MVSINDELSGRSSRQSKLFVQIQLDGKRSFDGRAEGQRHPSRHGRIVPNGRSELMELNFAKPHILVGNRSVTRDAGVHNSHGRGELGGRGSPSMCQMRTAPNHAQPVFLSSCSNQGAFYSIYRRFGEFKFVKDRFGLSRK